MTTPTLRPAVPGDAAAMARIKNRWIDETAWMPRVHPAEDVERHYREMVIADRPVTVAECAGQVTGYLAVDPGERFITSLFIDADRRGTGIGKRLLDFAKDGYPSGLWLWTFVANTQAQRFYLREGFAEVRRSDGDNEEGLPDILYQWPGD